MVSVEEAARIVLANLYKPTVSKVDLNDAYGNVLGDTVRADRDFPPFNRVAMDGIAIAYSEWRAGRKEFVIEGMQRAGQSQTTLSDVEQAIEVMTGAILPDGTDTVIRFEDVVIQKNRATILIDKVEEGQNIHVQGSDAQQDDELLSPGLKLSPAEIALLASLGYSDVPVFTYPRTAIISSGDELVEVNEIPEAHQIRRSNTYAIQAAMKNLGWTGTQYHLHDQKDFVIQSLEVIAAGNEVMIISGGVSKGRYDFIPEGLEAIGIKKLFHQVSQRPGKPFWFGVSKKGTVVFALPGNPVSTYMCFYRYIVPWLCESLGGKYKPARAVLAQDFTFQPDLTYFLQARIDNEDGCLKAYPVKGGGSGDFANLKNVDGFLELPMGRNEFKVDEIFDFYPFR